MNIGHMACILPLLMFAPSAMAQTERELIDKHCIGDGSDIYKLDKIKSCHALIDSGQLTPLWKGAAYSGIGTAFLTDAVSDAVRNKTKINSTKLFDSIFHMEMGVKYNQNITILLADVYGISGIYSDADFNVRVGYIRKSLDAWTSSIQPIEPGLPESRKAYSGRGQLRAKICDPIGAEADLRSAINIAKKLNTNGALDAEINGYLTSITAIDSECRPEMKDVNWK